MRYLILSDIHANWDALEAVLGHTAGQYDSILCCGDLVGYGPDPNPVVDWARANLAAVVRGNHDRAGAGIEKLEWFNPVARAAAVWTQQVLTEENGAYVRELPKGPLPVDDFQLVHGSPLDEDGYVVTSTDAGYTFPYLDHELTFFGHTHLQGGFLYTRLRAHTISRPKSRSDEEALQLDPDTAYLINPGAVGQPRDGDPRAAYILYHPEERCLWFRRVEYDVERVQAKIRSAHLPDSLAERLAVGR